MKAMEMPTLDRKPRVGRVGIDLCRPHLHPLCERGLAEAVERNVASSFP